MAELAPTPKILSELRLRFPKARLTGWKYEVEGTRAGAVRAAVQQIADCLTDACVANGPGYGPGFGLVRGGGEWVHLTDTKTLFAALERLIRE